jgi:hypothetical protein
MRSMLTIQRRHSQKCPDRDEGPNYLKCRGHCPLRICGTEGDGRRVRLSLKTRDVRRAARRLAEIEDRASGRPRKTMTDAVIAFQAQHEDNDPETKRRYNRTLRYFTEFCKRDSLAYLDQIDVEAMDRFAPSRNKIKSWKKDVELLKQFFEFGIEPPAPAFSGLLIDKAKWFRMRVSSWLKTISGSEQLGWFGLTWDGFGSPMFPYCSPISELRHRGCVPLLRRASAILASALAEGD